MEERYERSWDPKYAAIGVGIIALVVFLLDILPGRLRRRVRQSAEAAESMLEE